LLGWVAAKDLTAGTYLQTKTESWLDIDRVDQHTGFTQVYNFEVAGFHTYFVSDLGFLVHNACVRLDTFAYEPFARGRNRDGQPGEPILDSKKSHIDSNGDIVPANPENPGGLQMIYTHVDGNKRLVGSNSKNDSPYTSFSENLETGFFGSKDMDTSMINLDLDRLRADIKNKRVNGVKIIEHRTMVKVFDERVRLATIEHENAIGTDRQSEAKQNLDNAVKALDNTTKYNEVLIKGVLPKEYFTVSTIPKVNE
jgi:hypothetical protein